MGVYGRSFVRPYPAAKGNGILKPGLRDSARATRAFGGTPRGAKPLPAFRNSKFIPKPGLRDSLAARGAFVGTPRGAKPLFGAKPLPASRNAKFAKPGLRDSAAAVAPFYGNRFSYRGTK